MSIVPRICAISAGLTDRTVCVLVINTDTEELSNLVADCGELGVVGRSEFSREFAVEPVRTAGTMAALKNRK